MTLLSAPPAARRGSGALIFVKAAITLGLLGFLVYKTDIRATALQVASIGFGAFTLCTLVILALSVLVSLRWKVILDVMESPLDLLVCWRLVMIGLFFNQTLPSSIGGDAVRIWLTSRLGKSLRRSFISVLLDRLFALIAVGICLWVALPLMLRGPEAPLALFVSSVALVCTVGLFVMDPVTAQLSPLASRWRNGRLGTMATRPLTIARELSRNFARILRQPRAGATVMGISIVNQVALGLVVYILGRALGANLGLVPALLLFPLAMLLTMMPISVGGWGVREAAMVWMFSTVGVSSQNAFSISVLFGLVTTAAGLPGGILWLLDRRTAANVPSPPSASDRPRVVSESVSRISPWVSIRERVIDFGDGRVESYHAVAQTDYTAILAVTPDGRIPLVRQYRPALDRYTWEFPAGMVEDGEAPEVTCTRELLEETGLVAKRFHPLGTFVADSARLANQIHSFLVETEEPSGAPAELEVAYVTLEELQARIQSGQFDLQYHVAALGLAIMRPDMLRLLQGMR